MSRSGISTLGALRDAVERGDVPRRSVQRRSPRQPHSQAARRRDRSSPASSATTTPSCRSSSTRCFRSTTSSCSACAARQRRACCARSSRCSTRRFPVMPGCEINDDPLAPICAACRARIASEGDRTPIAWLSRDLRYVEKLATPDVTIADMVGDIDPIKAARVRPAALQRADDALRSAAAGQSRHLRHQRAAGPGRQDPGRAVQHPAGRRRPD